MKQGFQENVTVHDGTSVGGIETILHYEGDFLTVQRRYDAEPHLNYAKQAREQTEGKRWGEGRMVGHIPPLEYARFLAIKDNAERTKAIRTWLQENQGFVMFDKYLKR